MFNKFRLKQILAEYKKVFIQHQWPNEKYKWEAIQCFQENWDINSPDFAQMLKKSLDHARMLRNLLARACRYSLYLSRPRLRCGCTFRILFRLTSTEATS